MKIDVSNVELIILIILNAFSFCDPDIQICDKFFTMIALIYNILSFKWKKIYLRVQYLDI